MQERAEQKQEIKEWMPTGHRILVTGFSGQVGSSLVEQAQGKDELVCVSRGSIKHGFIEGRGLKVINLDLTQYSDVCGFIEETRPSLVLHFAAIADLDYCEQNLHEAYAVNLHATTNLAHTCLRLGIPMGFCSTEYVFQKRGGVFSEENEVGEKDEYGLVRGFNIYSDTKILAERCVRNVLFEKNLGFIFRISFPYNPFHTRKPGTPVECFNRLARGEGWTALWDFVMTPTSTRDIAFALNRLIADKVWQENSPIFHIAGPDSFSGVKIARICVAELKRRGLRINRKPIEEEFVDDFFKKSGRAPRPVFMCLDTRKIRDRGISLSGFPDEVKKFPLPKDQAGSS